MKEISDVLMEMMTREEIGIVYKKIVRPSLLKFFHGDPEPLHNVFLNSLHYLGGWRELVQTIERLSVFKDEALEQKIWGFNFPNPFALADGFDKNGWALLGIPVLGTGFHIIGTLTPKLQEGFPQQRIYYLEQDEGLINKMGFPNRGVKAVVGYVKEVRNLFPLPLGINIGKGIDTPIEKATNDYLYCLEKAYEVGDFFVVNVSCPHMPGLCELRGKEYFGDLIFSLKEKIKELGKQTGLREKPLLVKISPDDSREKISELLNVCLDYEIDGIIAVNTTSARRGLKSPNRVREGGYSGEKLFSTAVNRVRCVSNYTEGKIPVIGVGGVSSAEDAYEMFKAGASLVQIYTAFAYQIWKGPWFFYELNKGIKELMEQDGFRHISEVRKLGSESSERKLE